MDCLSVAGVVHLQHVIPVLEFGFEDLEGTWILISAIKSRPSRRKLCWKLSLLNVEVNIFAPEYKILKVVLQIQSSENHEEPANTGPTKSSKSLAEDLNDQNPPGMQSIYAGSVLL